MSRAWAFMERVDAPDYDKPERNYMTRWRVIGTPLFGLYVHRLERPDPRRTLHDHPWPFVTLVLKGGYTEDFGVRATRGGDRTGPIVKRSSRSWRRWTFHRMRKTDAHTITSVSAPTLTLLVVGRRRREPSWATGTTPAGPHTTSTRTRPSSPRRRRPATKATSRPSGMSTAPSRNERRRRAAPVRVRAARGAQPVGRHGGVADRYGDLACSQRAAAVNDTMRQDTGTPVASADPFPATATPDCPRNALTGSLPFAVPQVPVGDPA